MKVFKTIPMWKTNYSSSSLNGFALLHLTFVIVVFFIFNILFVVNFQVLRINTNRMKSVVPRRAPYYPQMWDEVD